MDAALVGWMDRLGTGWTLEVSLAGEHVNSSPTIADAVPKEDQVGRVLLAFPGQVPSPEGGQD